MGLQSHTEQHMSHISVQVTVHLYFVSLTFPALLSLALDPALNRYFCLNFCSWLCFLGMPNKDSLLSKWDSENSWSVVLSQFLRISPVVDCEEIKVNGEVLNNHVVVAPQ